MVIVYDASVRTDRYVYSRFLIVLVSFLGNVYDRGTFGVENGVVTLISRRGDTMPVADDGTFTYLFARGAAVEMTLSEEIMTKLKAQ